MSENTQNNLSNPGEPGDEILAARLSNHLRAELDGQLGRSAEGFRLYARAEQRAGFRNTRDAAPRPVWRGGPWTFALVGGALAASVALLVSSAAPFLRGTSQSGTTPTRATPVSTGATPVVRTDTTTRTHYYDAGTTFDEQGRPVRRIRRVNIQERRWLNEATGEQMEQVVPSEDEMQLELKTY